MIIIQHLCVVTSLSGIFFNKKLERKTDMECIFFFTDIATDKILQVNKTSFQKKSVKL